MQRNNLKLNDTNVITARVLGTIGYSLADGVKHKQQSKQNSAPLQAIYNLQYQTQMQDPKFRRKEMKRKYKNKSYKLQPGDWGFITQSRMFHRNCNCNHHRSLSRPFCLLNLPIRK